MVGERLLMRVWDLYVQVTGIRFLTLLLWPHVVRASAPIRQRPHVT